MPKYRHSDETVEFEMPSAITAGTILIVGTQNEAILVPVDAATGVKQACYRRGVVELNKLIGFAPDYGTDVYVSAATATATAVASGGSGKIGRCCEYPVPSLTVRVALNA